MKKTNPTLPLFKAGDQEQGRLVIKVNRTTPHEQRYARGAKLLRQIKLSIANKGYSK